MRVNLEARAAAAAARRARTRERLLDAAMQVLGEKGPDVSSIEDFVAKAEVSRGTFYNHFPTVEALLEAVRQRIAATLTAALEARLPEDAPAAERLATRLHSFHSVVTRDAAWGWVMLRLDGSRLEQAPLLAAQLDEVFRAGVAEGGFRSMDPAGVRTLVFGSSRMLQRDILSGRSSPEHAVQVIALLLTACGLPYDEAVETSRRCAARAREIHDAASAEPPKPVSALRRQPLSSAEI